MRRDVREFIEEQEKDGWELLGRAGNGHYKMRLKGTGHTYCVHSTPSDHRNLKNTRSDMRRVKAQALANAR